MCVKPAAAALLLLPCCCCPAAAALLLLPCCRLNSAAAIQVIADNGDLTLSKQYHLHRSIACVCERRSGLLRSLVLGTAQSDAAASNKSASLTLPAACCGPVLELALDFIYGQQVHFEVPRSLRRCSHSSCQVSTAVPLLLTSGTLRVRELFELTGQFIAESLQAALQASFFA